MDESLEDLVKRIQQESGFNQKKLPPVRQWHPETEVKIDLKVDRNGDWYYQGGKIKRAELVRIFSSILRKEHGNYYLVTPVEKCLIDVAVAPLVVTRMEKKRLDGKAVVIFSTRTGDCFPLNSEHPIHLVEKELDEVPIVMVRDDLEAIIARPVFYELAELVEYREVDGVEKAGIMSCGEFIVLG